MAEVRFSRSVGSVGRAASGNGERGRGRLFRAVFETLPGRTYLAATVTPLPSLPVDDHPAGCTCGLHGGAVFAERTAPTSGYDPNAAELYITPTKKLTPNSSSLLSANSPSLLPASYLASPATGSLATKVAYIAAGHGRLFLNNAWNWERGLLGTAADYDQHREDHGNADQLAFLAQYLLNAGATVVPSRPIGSQPAEVIVDNRQATYTGSWSGGSSTPYYSSAADNGGLGTTTTATGGRYAVASGSLTESAAATFTPTIPSTGFYPVYAWALDGTNRAKDQTYRINYTGGSVEVKVNHQYTGKGWVYLGTYYFAAGTGGNVQVSNKTADPTKFIVADAIRFGNGMGDVSRGTGVSGQRREDEAAAYWYQNARGWTSAGNRDTTVAVTTGDTDDFSDNIGGQPKYFGYMNNSAAGNMEERLHLSYHSNAANGTARGSVGLITTSPTPNQAYWAGLVSDEVDLDLVAINGQFEASWNNRSGSTFSGGYGEISNSNFTSTSPGGTTAEMDGTILEIGYHDTPTDRRLLLDPKFRAAVGRSSYHAFVKYFNNFSADSGLTDTTTLPEPVARTRAGANASAEVVVNWVAGPSGTGASEAYGDTATGFIIQASTNGYGFTTIATVAGGATATYTVPAATAAIYGYYRVIATNSGGAAFPGEVVAAKPAATAQASKFLIVDGFSRIDRFTNDLSQQSVGGSRVRLRFNNTGDYTVDAASALAAADSTFGFDTATTADIEASVVQMSNYTGVIWLAGEQATMNIGGSSTPALSSTAQTRISTYLSAGGKLFISGSEIGYDLVTNNQGPSFITSTLRAGYVSDDANVFAATGSAGSIFAGISLNFDDGTSVFNMGKYRVEFPDVISASGGSTLAMNYSGGSSGAAIQYSSGNTRLVYLAFPFETITTSANRNAVMAAVVNYFGVSAPATPPPAVPVLTAGDTGISASDRLTRFNNASPATALTFAVADTVVGATVRLYANGILIGSAVATGTTTTITTNGTSVIPAGTSSITARQQVGIEPETGDSPAVSLTVDITGPTVDILDISPDPRNSAVSSALMLFSENIFGLTTTGLSLTRDGSANLLTGGESIGGAGGTFSISGLSSLTAAAGVYTFTATTASTATDAAGNPLASPGSDSFAVNTVVGDAIPNAADTIRLAPVVGQPTQINIFVNTSGSSPTHTWTFAPTGSLILRTLGGDDTLIIEGALPVPVSFDGGAGNDRLRILPAGSVALSLPTSVLTAPAASVAFAGLENIEALAATGLAVTGSAAAEALILADHASGSLLTGTSGGNPIPATVFADSPISLNLLASGQSDSLDIPSGTHHIDDLIGWDFGVAIQTGAAVTLNKSTTFSALTISGTATSAAGRQARLSATSLVLTGQLNLNDNDLLLDYSITSPFADILAALAAGRITSLSDFSGLPTGLYAADAGNLGLSTYAGQPIDETTLILKYTFIGDANLDGQVDALDYERVDLNIGNTGLADTAQGDLNADGVVDALDYEQIDLNIGNSGLA